MDNDYTPSNSDEQDVRVSRELLDVLRRYLKENPTKSAQDAYKDLQRGGYDFSLEQITRLKPALDTESR